VILTVHLFLIVGYKGGYKGEETTTEK